MLEGQTVVEGYLLASFVTLLFKHLALFTNISTNSSNLIESAPLLNLSNPLNNSNVSTSNSTSND